VLLPLGTTFINELAPRRISNRFSLWGVTLGWSLGGMLAGLAGVFLTPIYGWQALYYAGATSLLLTLVVHLVLPESPKFLAASGRIDELRALLSRIRPERRDVYANATFRSTESKAGGNTIGVLLGARYWRVSLTIWLTAFRLRRLDAGDVVRWRARFGHAGGPAVCAGAGLSRGLVDYRRVGGDRAGVREYPRSQSRHCRGCRLFRRRRATCPQ
jgi:MFS family permease